MTTPTATAATIEVNGRPVELREGGAGEPLLYLHGLLDLHSGRPDETWPAHVAGLAAGARVLAPALPGYAGSGGTESMDGVEDDVFHLLDLLDALGLATVDVVGHSLGGWLAAELAVRRSDRIRRLVLVSPLGLHVPGCRPAQFFGAVAPRGVANFAEGRAVLFADPDGAAARHALPDDMEEGHQLRWFQGLAGAARIGWDAPQLSDRKLRSHLHRITCPTLLVCGERDVLTPLEHARAWEEGIAGARLEVVAGAGHSVPLERADELTALVRAFLS